MIVAAHQHESLDGLIWRATGRGSAALAPVLASNPGLAALATRLPEGTPVTVPALASTPATVDLIQLWD